MNEKWLEEIKRNDEMRMLDRYFPGKSCGNAECERLCTSACAIAKKMNVSPNELVDYAIQQEIVPRHACKKVLQLADYPNSKNYPNQGKPIPGCRFGYTYGSHPPKTDDQLSRELSKISPSRSILKQGKGHKVQFHVEGSPSPGIFAESSSFDGIEDLLTQLEKKYPAGSIDHLIITNHSGDGRSTPLAKEGSTKPYDLYHIGNRANKDNLARLKKMLAPNATIELRMCRDAEGKVGKERLQHIADVTGCEVIGYENKVNPIGGKAPRTIFMPGKKTFYPNIETK